LAPALAEYRRNLERVVGLTRGRGVRLILLTEPVLWHEGLAAEDRALLWMGGNGDFMRRPVDEYYSIGALARGMASYNEVTSSLARDEHVESLDLAAMLPRTREAFYDDCHFNENGARQLAELVAAYLASRPPWAGTRRSPTAPASAPAP
jgi:hypothetical protein